MPYALHHKSRWTYLSMSWDKSTIQLKWWFHHVTQIWRANHDLPLEMQKTMQTHAVEYCTNRWQKRVSRSGMQSHQGCGPIVNTEHSSRGLDSQECFCLVHLTPCLCYKTFYTIYRTAGRRHWPAWPILKNFLIANCVKWFHWPLDTHRLFQAKISTMVPQTQSISPHAGTKNVFLHVISTSLLRKDIATRRHLSVHEQELDAS